MSQTDKGIFNDTITPSEAVENATSVFFKDRMKELVQKQYDEVIGKQQDERLRNRAIEKHQIENQEMMQNQMQQLNQKQSMEMPYTVPQYNYSPAYMQQMAQQQAQQMQPYFCQPQMQMPMQMPYPMMMPQQGVPQSYMQMPMQMQQYPQQQMYNQPQQMQMAQQQVMQQNQEIIQREEIPEGFDLEQLDKLYSNSPVENAFKNIQLKPKKEERPVQEKVQEVVEEPQKQQVQPQQQVKQVEELKPQEVVEEIHENISEPVVAPKEQEIINVEPSDELTEEDLDMISELDVELHQAEVEEQKAQEKASEPIIPKYIDDTPEEPSLPVFPQPELQSNKNINFEKNDRVRHSKFGEGVVEKVINYGNKKLCSIYFEKVGRRLLEPHVSELEKI